MTTTPPGKLTKEFMDALGSSIAESLVQSWSCELRKELYENKLEYLLDDDVLKSLSQEQFDELEAYFTSDEVLDRFKFVGEYI